MSKSTPSPIGIARYPNITQPDSFGKYADGKFKTQLVVSKKDAAPMVESLKALAKENKVAHLPFKEDGDSIVFKFKSKYRPMIVDARNKKVEKLDLRIGGGSKIRVGYTVYPYDKGLALQMTHVQVLALEEAGESIFEPAEDGTFDASTLGKDADAGVFEDSGLDI